MAIRNNIVAKKTTELVLLFHKKTTKLFFLVPNMGQKNIKVLIKYIINVCGYISYIDIKYIVLYIFMKLNNTIILLFYCKAYISNNTVMVVLSTNSTAQFLFNKIILNIQFNYFIRVAKMRSLMVTMATRCSFLCDKNIYCQIYIRFIHIMSKRMRRVQNLLGTVQRYNVITTVLQSHQIC